MFVITSMPVGGAETLLVNMLDRFDAARTIAEVTCLKEPGPLGQQIAGRFAVHSGLLSGKWDCRVLPRLVRLFRRRRIDAVITVGAGDKMFWGRLAAWMAGVPVIASALHSTGWPDGVGRLNRLLTPITDAFIAVADSHGQFMRTHERFPQQRIQVIRNGVDTDRFRPDAEAAAMVRAELAIPADAPLVGIVAALRPEKNHALFLKAAAGTIAQRPETHFLIVGVGPERVSIERGVVQRGLEHRVHLLGTRHVTPRLVAALDLFLLCSHNEASPVSILEALACEVPVISTRVGSIAETVADGQCGHLIDPDDGPAMIARVTELLGDPALRRQMGAAGRQRVIRTASLAAMVEGYQRLVETAYDHRSDAAAIREKGRRAAAAVASPWRRLGGAK